METRANFILIGLFTLAGAIGIVGLFLWFARVELDRQFDYYDIRFTSVSGLSEASDVRFSGLPVGQVVDVRLSPDQDGTILVRVEVDAETPVRVDSVATIEAQGVTGVSFVLIGPGTLAAPLLEPSAEKPVPELTAGRSVFQSLSEEAPQLINETLRVVEEVGLLFGGENQARFQRILVNVEDASDDLATTLEDFSAAASSVSEFTERVEEFNAILETVADDLEDVLQTADTTLAAIGELSDEAEMALTTGTETLEVAQGAISAAETYIAEDLTATTDALRVTVTELRTEIATLSEDAQGLIATFNTTGETATTRLTEAEATLDAVDGAVTQLTETLGSVDTAAAQVTTLLETEGGPLLSEARAAVARATEAIEVIATAAETDLPQMVADIRSATDTASTVIAEVAEDLSSASGRIEGLTISAETALTQVTETFSNANTTLEAITGAMVTGERTLEVAERAFAGADQVISEDLGGIVDGLEASLATLNGAIAQVSEDIPEITGDLRAASQSAEDAFATLRDVIASSGPAVTEFTRTGLPLYTRLADETRALIRNLDRLTQQIQRDPARFFLDRQSPEFQR